MSVESAVIIPKNELDPVLEEKVKYYLSLTPDLPRNEKMIIRAKTPEGADPYELDIWRREELRRIKEGHFGMSPKMYFFYNYVRMWDIESGIIRPEYRVCQQEWFNQIESAQNSKEFGVICVKRRRIGASWLMAADAYHDCLMTALTPNGRIAKIGMTSKTKEDAIELFKKVKFIYDNVPDWMRLTSSAGNNLTSLDFSEYVKDENGSRKKVGTRAEIVVKAPQETAWEGFGLNKWIADESGKIGNLKALFSMSNEIMRLGTRRIGTPVVFGTAGDITKEGKDFKEMWYNSDIYKLNKFFFGGWNGIICDEFGNDLKEDAIRWIVYERKRREGLSTKEYNDFLQQYPLTVQEAFTSNEQQGLGNQMKIVKQLHSLYENPVKEKKGYFMLNGKEEIVFKPDNRGSCIIYEEPILTEKNNYAAGCLPPGEKVVTTSGLMNIEDVGLTDVLINDEGLPVEINTLLRYHVEKEAIYKISLANTFRKTTFTKEHPILISDRRTLVNNKKHPTYRVGEYIYNFDFKYKRCEEIKAGQWVRIPNIYRENKGVPNVWPVSGRIDRVVRSPLECDDFWWLMGLFIGDGWVTRDKISVSFNVKETLSIDRFKKTIVNLLKRTPQERIKKNCVEISFDSKQLSEFINSNFGKYAIGKKIPEWVKYLPNHLKKEFILGFLDSDGCVTFSDSRKTWSTEFVSINLPILESVQDMLFSLGVVSSVTKLRNQGVHVINGRNCPTKETYHLRISHGHSLKLRDILGNSGYKISKINPILDKKERKTPRTLCFLSPDETFIYFKITNIEKSQFTGVVYNFDCKTHTFLCHHISTHNCDPTDHESDTPGLSNLSMFIMKRPDGISPPKIVFKYTDRPHKPRDFYEQALMALLYYNKTKVLIERNKYGMISYFDERGYKFLLQTSPQGYTRLIGGNTYNIGYYRTPAAKRYGEELVGDYIEEYCDYIPCKSLLQELQEYGVKNTDEVDAFQACLMFLKEMQNTKITSVSDKSNIPSFGYKRVNGRIVSYKKEKGEIHLSY